MGISIITAVEIFTNPGDLEFNIGFTIGKESGKFSISIFRGPSHNFKPLITSPPFAEKLEDAVEAIKERLEAIQQYMTKELEDPASHLLPYLNPDGGKIDQSKILSPDLINRIVNELHKHRTASTCTMLTPKS